MVLDIKSFREWLMRHNTDDIVGYTSVGDKCPIALYLKTQCSPETTVVVDGIRAWSYSPHYRFFVIPTWKHDTLPLECWARDFVTGVDALGHKGTPVRVSDALKVLDNDTN